jgi:hypothetical protein
MTLPTRRPDHSPSLIGGDDPFEDALIGVIFPKTTARAYPAMLAIADKAMRHRRSDDGGKLYHHVAFSRTAQGARAAIALVEMVRSLAGVQLYAGGRVSKNAFGLAEVLECYANAESCRDPTAWCLVVTDDAFVRGRAGGGASAGFSMASITGWELPPQGPQTWVFPCRYLHGRNGFRIDPRHPAKPVDQLEAGAVHAGCHWCPRFTPQSLRKLEQ